MRVLVSDMAGRSSVELKAAELGHQVPASSTTAARVAERVKVGEEAGLAYEAADASFELSSSAGRAARPGGAAARWEVSTTSDAGRVAIRAVVEVETVPPGAAPVHRGATGWGDDVVEALDDALRRALAPLITRSRELVAHRVRVLPAVAGPPSTRVLTTHRDGDRVWGAVGVDRDPAAAAVAALVDAYRHTLLHQPEPTPVGLARRETSDASV
jgi:2-isopropylmalate synthase